MTKDLIIGIDLGTTYSLCSVLQSGIPTLIPNALGEVLTASAVSVDESGHVLVGAPARARAATHPALTALAFKRDMGTDKEYVLGGQRFRPETLSALVLAELKRDAEAVLGAKVVEAVITVPAYFGELQRTATRNAGELAGLRVERIINEPTAAAMAYGLHARGKELRGIVLDLGGGTFDVTVLEITEGVIEVQASAGDARLGGEDFADLLAAELARELRESHAVEVEHDARVRARVREAAESMKQQLSHVTQARAVLVGMHSRGGTRDVELSVTRERAEAIWQPLLDRLRQPIARAMRDANIKPSALDEVLVVGGASRMPCFLELVAKSFARMPSRNLPPDEAVAMGAAVQAALRAQDTAVEDLLVTDIAPFSLGISAATRFGQRTVEGMFTPIIERGTVIPVSRSEVFQTLQNNQRSIKVEVYQGEHPLCRDNVKLGEYEVSDLPLKPAGEARIEVRFTYDLNGILEVESTIVGTNTTRVLVIEKRPGVLSRRELSAAREAMKRLKFHPRDALPNRTALARADALYVELTGDQRALLGAAIAELGGALETQDASAIETTRERLVALTGALRSGSR
jgi:molecular chaperone HscC